ncbi:MAG: SDR family NAD(P)-dependent oxidoreductase [Rhodospirillales bacterium]|nr:SDR family NAD(P)-dependent oxidoreductase [Rhodospirillales bacterium]MBO6787823.1 SDR family NAD(P)-dependent oxidoreductase [Rhodospirillales bacterium]
MDVKGHAAIVTGAASGLGAATAKALAANGAKVALLDLNAEDAGKLADDIGGIAIGCDVSSAESAEEAIKAARDRHGPARILVSCAGIAPPKRIVGRDGPQPLENFASVINVNLIGTFNVMRLAAADMVAQDVLETGERGVIINTASVAAFDGQIGQAAYAASKGGVASMTLPAARELARSGVRVLAIAPGIFGTPMLFGLPEDVQKALGDSVPFPSRLGDPSEYAALALHMVENVMLNGEVVRLDGALRMAPQ